MTLHDPLWQQQSTYSAKRDRSLLRALFTEGVLPGPLGASDPLRVSQRGAGANMSVDVAAGFGVITGDDEANQGNYLVESDAVANVVIGAAPGANSRIDLVVARVRDAQVTGADNDWIIEVVAGTVAGSPVAPAVPNTAIPLAEVLVAAGTVSITDAMVTDRRGFASAASVLVDVTEKVKTIAALGTAPVLDFDEAAVFVGTLSAAAVVSFENPPAAGYAQTITFVVKNTGTAYSITWPASVKWAAGVTPSLAGINKADVFAFTTYDGGVTYIGHHAANYSGLG